MRAPTGMLDWFRPHANPIPIAIAMWSLPGFCAGPGAIDDEASAMIASSFMAPVVKKEDSETNDGNLIDLHMV
uniref:Uncharacterized protein n=1 Tax=Zea mays TaxID=4577 RepID=A0A804LSU7_MAIZE